MIITLKQEQTFRMQVSSPSMHEKAVLLSCAGVSFAVVYYAIFHLLATHLPQMI